MKNKSIKEKLINIIDKDAKEADFYNYDKSEWSDLTFEEKLNEWLARNYIEDYFDELGIKEYNGSLELSDTPVLNSFTNEYIASLGDEVALDFYMNIVRNVLTSFEKRMQEMGLLQGEVWQDGRSGRHVVIENNINNILNYDKIKEEYIIEETQFIEFLNNYEGEK